jgi:16S rRNA G966 N2-methylase RsmD
MIKKEVYKEHFSPEEKKEIAKSIKPITKEQIREEFYALKKIGEKADTMSERCRTGNNVVDFFTFAQRLETRGKYDVNYFSFIENLDSFSQKKFIQTMLTYYETTKNKNNTKNKYVVWKEVYNICISAINIIRPLVYMEIYTKYNPTCILDFCAGWGGAVVAAAALNVPNYVGIEINQDLKEPYKNLIDFLQEQGTTTDIDVRFQDAVNVDYSLIDYDLVFTSPPYYFIQKYKNNREYKGGKKEMDELFYKPVFSKTYYHLKKGGYYVLNINREVYERVCIELFGEAVDVYSYKKSKRQNKYEERVYVWKK